MRVAVGVAVGVFVGVRVGVWVGELVGVRVVVCVGGVDISAGTVVRGPEILSRGFLGPDELEGLPLQNRGRQAGRESD